MLATLTKSYDQANAQALAAPLRKAHPQKSIRTLSYMCSGGRLIGLGVRNNVTRIATMKHAQKAAPVDVWHYTWRSPMLATRARGTRRSCDLLRQHRALRPGHRQGSAGPALRGRSRRRGRASPAPVPSLSGLL